MSDYERILDLITRIKQCASTVDAALPDRTAKGNLRARNYAAQLSVDARELEDLLLQRHLRILEDELRRRNDAEAVSSTRGEEAS
jgi:hypothetical protein